MFSLGVFVVGCLIYGFSLTWWIVLIVWLDWLFVVWLLRHSVVAVLDLI